MQNVWRILKRREKRIAETVKKVQNIRYDQTKPYGRGATSIIDINQEISILFVEDSDGYFEIIKTVFEGMEHVRLIRGKTIADAISLLTGSEIDLILLDYLLPDGTGFDFMAQALEKGITTPVVVLTEKGDERIESRLVQKGASDCLPKVAFGRESILRSISNALEKTRLKKEIRVAQDKMARMAAKDTLTGLYNRRLSF